MPRPRASSSIRWRRASRNPASRSQSTAPPASHSPGSAAPRMCLMPGSREPHQRSSRKAARAYSWCAFSRSWIRKNPRGMPARSSPRRSCRELPTRCRVRSSRSTPASCRSRCACSSRAPRMRDRTRSSSARRPGSRWRRSSCLTRIYSKPGSGFVIVATRPSLRSPRFSFCCWQGRSSTGAG